MTSTNIDIHSLEELHLKAYWALEKLTSDKKDRFSSSDIANYLIEKVGISTSRQAIEYAMKKEKSACNKNKHGYKLMHEGRSLLQNRSRVVFVDAGKPFATKNYTVKEIIGIDYKELAICDPYVDVNTLDIIYRNFLKNVPIRILTANVIDKPLGSFKRQLTDINKEGYKVEVRKYTNSPLHDRYIISDKHFWLSGNSLNYIGNKESFIVLLGEDIRQSMVSTFNSRWKIATLI